MRGARRFRPVAPAPVPETLVTHPPNPDPPLRPYEANVTSDCGEDGIIAHALEVIGERSGWCCEFGAWDGRHASNTWSLITERGYRAVLIEADPGRFAALEREHAGRPVHALRRMVGWDGPDRLDAVLGETPIPLDFDVLSIDVDGTDWFIWEGLTEYRPKIVVCEYNPTIPNEVDFVQARDPAVAQGCSLTALCRLGAAKGYHLIHATSLNGIFVRDDHFHKFGIFDPSPYLLRADLSQITWMFQTYDGRVHLAGFPRVRWHDLPLDAGRLQPLPRWLLGFPDDLSAPRRLIWRLWRAAHDPPAAARRLSERARRIPWRRWSS